MGLGPVVSRWRHPQREPELPDNETVVRQLRRRQREKFCRELRFRANSAI